ncbi:hypothetical protein [Vibrio parahaemolyticus]|uniref:hypothetical protein n=1 Tax=Vibrio parahaemolyticus TaxID=670 RepID=UPI0004E71B2F|nr:hypothetical protein [Vibrio parahaemolyticus]KFE94885.1 hypothetical protein HB39_12300 [Vibrio parahaemolyticus]MBX5338922.1 hypothetical protein [Vibrio parahaemolyticus]
MSLETEVQELTKATNEQTAVSQALAQEVAGKMGDIDKKVSDAEKKFNDFVSGDFDENVGSALTLEVHIDPISGNDTNDGSTSGVAIKSSERLEQIVKQAAYQYVVVRIKSGTELILTKSIVAQYMITIVNYGDGQRAVLRQGLVSNATLRAEHVRFIGVDTYTYKAAENEAIAQPSYSSRALLGRVYKLTTQNADIHVCDNQLFHYHNGGSGDYFYPIIISLYNTSFVSEPSEAGVTGSIKKAFSYFAGIGPYPVDLFGAVVTVTLNGVHADLQTFLGCSTQNLRTNLTLT